MVIKTDLSLTLLSGLWMNCNISWFRIKILPGSKIHNWSLHPKTIVTSWKFTHQGLAHTLFQQPLSFLPSVLLLQPRRRHRRATCQLECVITVIMIGHVVVNRHFYLIFLFELLLFIWQALVVIESGNVWIFFRDLSGLLNFTLLRYFQKTLNLLYKSLKIFSCHFQFL